MKFYLYITNPESFLKGDYFCSVRATTDKDWHDRAGYELLAEVDLSPELMDRGSITQKAVYAIECEERNERAKFELVLNDLAQRKSNLLAITHNPSEEA